jgi:hypothetical protein
MSLRLPPYGADLMRMRRAGRKPVKSAFGHIVVSTAWDVEGDFARVVVTPDMDPTELEFAFCAGLDVCIAHRDAELDLFSHKHDEDWLALLVLSILECNPARLDVMNLERRGMKCFLRRAQHA